MKIISAILILVLSGCADRYQYQCDLKHQAEADVARYEACLAPYEAITLSYEARDVARSLCEHEAFAPQPCATCFQVGH